MKTLQPLGDLIRSVIRLANSARSRKSGLREFGFLAGLYLIYLLTRIRSVGAVDEALRNARDLADWERRSGWLVERAAQELITGHAAVAVLFNLLYLVPHFLAVLGFLWWAYHRRPTAFPFARNLFFASSLVSFVMFVAYPVAPPTKVPELGIVDSMVEYGPVSYEMGADQLRNAVAAMPSVHVVYAIIASVGFATLLRSWWRRVLACLYIPLSIFVIMATGNHFLVDAAGAAVPILVGAPLAWFAPMIWNRSRARARLGGTS